MNHIELLRRLASQERTEETKREADEIIIDYLRRMPTDATAGLRVAAAAHYYERAKGYA